ncbi:MAG: hypothetical protein NUV98_00645, partial [Candidatus Roizmanbacteria bacterium]|nr:hypothetical protein [Candidatus Roizmanbacteria bacterium]
LGGGDCLAGLSLKLDVPTTVVTSPRHFDEQLPLYNCRFSDFLNKNGVKYLVVNDLSSKEILQQCPNSLGISFGAAWIFKKQFIDEFAGNLINAHGALLPRDRGAGGFSWRILMGDSRGASLLHLVDTGVDTGDIVDCQTYNFPADCRKPIDHYKYSVERYGPFLDSFFQKLKSGHNFRTSYQQEHLSTYWPRLNTSINGFINWSWDLTQVERFICAFDDPYSGASSFIAGIESPVSLKSCRTIKSDGLFHPFQYGIVYRIHEGSIFIASNGGSIVIDDIRDSKGNNMFRIVNLGDRFFTPVDFLEASMKSRPVYTAKGLN